MVGIFLSHPQNEARVWGSRHSWPSSTCTVTTQYFRTDDYNDLVITWNSSQFINECRMQLLFCANKAMQICTFISMAVGYPKLSLPQTPPLKQILSELAYCLKLIHEKSCLIYLCEQLSELEDPTCSNLYPLIHPCQSRATVLLSLSLSLSFISIPGSRQPHRFEPALWSLGTGPFLTSSLKQCTNLGHVQFPKLRAIWMCQTRSESWITAKYVFDFFFKWITVSFLFCNRLQNGTTFVGCRGEQEEKQCTGTKGASFFIHSLFLCGAAPNKAVLHFLPCALLSQPDYAAYQTVAYFQNICNHQSGEPYAMHNPPCPTAANETRMAENFEMCKTCDWIPIHNIIPFGPDWTPFRVAAMVTWSESRQEIGTSFCQGPVLLVGMW